MKFLAWLLGRGPLDPHSAPDQLLTGCTEGSEKYFWNESRESYTHLHSEFTDKAWLSASRHCLRSLPGVSCKSRAWIWNHECPTQCPGGATSEPEVTNHKNTSRKVYEGISRECSCPLHGTPQIPKWQLSFPSHEKKSTNNKCWRGCGEKETFLHHWWEFKSVQRLWKMVWKFLKKTKTELPYDPATPLPGTSPDKTIIWKDACTSMFTASTALFTIARTWKQSKCPSKGEWIKMWYIYPMEYYSFIKKKQIMLFSATWMNLEMIILGEVSQKEKDNIWYHLYVGSKI